MQLRIKPRTGEPGPWFDESKIYEQVKGYAITHGGLCAAVSIERRDGREYPITESKMLHVRGGIEEFEFTVGINSPIIDHW